ncbi:DUF7662 domain-containing protein [Deinococcus sonorensis]|uniref:DUF7662 domain-containing protein n=2 Tax=Deinococcus sonorensis TaxID=309891 RepID=A0AAU7UEW5_9DEIO
MNTLTVQLKDGETLLLNLETTTPAQPQEVLQAFMHLLNAADSTSPLPVSVAPIKGKYGPLADHLNAQDRPSLHLTFTQIEQLLGFPLPDSAQEHRAWWANDVTHSQARAWTAVGWQSSDVDLAARTVNFIRTPQTRADDSKTRRSTKGVNLVVGGIRVPLTRGRQSD